ncbi:uncharacterized protein E0L32_001859 [Thyridium curvatum]|uniref:20S-pre-rRNA D-site endonuclease NOB1 n=1 Tax=Thyridium curvatum TaxID=1093900 RepID=A0A507AP91_9PEZI|nr:uncharacterized protein E0L32_001820 [Thyridium curvatum]XP_030989995.1 uncharacterized protein E0L32_001859 [Thyridium curvatum]TPX08245.1 hypothetical protein E0L32_001820 [Thyridium curvatum]TPX08284.1 hypothetical protein E0L32_001859 [Thyridium curvatum]
MAAVSSLSPSGPTPPGGVSPAPNPTSASSTPVTAPTTGKPIHCLVIDTGPLIKNDPPVSTLLAQADELYTIPSVISEVRDQATRTRLETTLLPFLKLRSPKSDSVKFVTDFARRTGDLEVLSRADIHVVALTYELECERNGGDWRLKNTPTQKSVNGKPPGRPDGEKQDYAIQALDSDPVAEEGTQELRDLPNSENAAPPVHDESGSTTLPKIDDGITKQLAGVTLESQPAEEEEQGKKEEVHAHDTQESESGSDDDSDGWVTPSNFKRHQEQQGPSAAGSQPAQKFLKAAMLTSDFAMQNVALRINLNCCSPSLSRITQVKTWVLRCHGCYKVTRQMDKQFCPSCGQATLTRVSCSTDAQGNFKLHLKRNFQWSHRGNVYSVPKPTHGSANGKNTNVRGGGQNGWGRDLILAEDQKEYVKKQEEDRRTRYRDLMDEDYLPGILTGERRSANGRIKVGAGRNVNARKKR